MRRHHKSLLLSHSPHYDRDLLKLRRNWYSLSSLLPQILRLDGPRHALTKMSIHHEAINSTTKTFIQRLEDDYCSSVHLVACSTVSSSLQLIRISPYSQHTTTTMSDDPCITSSSSATIIHCNTATEQQVTTEGGSIQNTTINDSSTTTSTTSTAIPSLQPSSPPQTLRPTRNIIPFVLSGTLYYDINANSRRDENIAALYGETSHLGDNVEYNVGLGGVTVQLVECRNDDPSTANGDEEETQVVTAVTIGVNVQGRPNLIISGGNYNLVNIKVDRSYYINVKAPTGYLLTGGVCNDDDDEFGDWRKCDGGGILEWLSYYDGEGSTRRVLQQQGQNDATTQQQQQLELWQHSETKLGIPEGRSSKCVSVDQDGLVDSTLDIGVMRLGDTNTFVVGYNVILDRDDDDDDDTTTTAVITAPMTMTRRRRMRRNLEKDKEQPTSPLLPEDLDAIRNVVTEIFAVNLQKTLVQNNLSFVQIDEVFSVDVQYYPVNAITAIDDEDGANNLFGDNTKSGDATTDSMVGTTKKLFQNAQSRSGGNEEVDFFTSYSLSVDLIVKGHYRKDMDVNNGGGDVTNATTIVNLIQDVTSGNTTQDEALFQDLLGYNTMCLEQM
eukprot:scaffold1855_cov126-Skeletonema_marinoi.AAC.4